MDRAFRFLGATCLFVVMVFFAGAPAEAQYGPDPSESVTIGGGFADAEGVFFRRYTAPAEIEEAFLIYVIGTDEDGEHFEFVIANVTPSFAGLSWTLDGHDMQPGSEYTLEARYEPGTDLTSQVLGMEQLPQTGANTRGIAGLGVVLAVLGGALFYGARIGARHAPA